MLRQACDYLCNGASQAKLVIDQKIDTAKVQLALGEIATQIQRMQACLEDG